MIKYYLLTIVGFALAVVTYGAYASSVPVGVTIKAVNCPAGSVLVVNDVETGIFVDNRGKLTTTISGLAGYKLSVQMHNIPESKDFELIETTAAAFLKITLDCAGISFVERRGL